MPITINLPNGLGGVGPGLPISLSSDFVGPLPLNTRWEVGIYENVELTHIIWRERFDSQLPFLSFTWATNQSLSQVNADWTVQPGATVHVGAQILVDSTVTDSGSVQTTWQPTIGLGAQSSLQGQAGGGLTDEEHQLLVDTNVATTVLGNPQDLVIQTPSGPHLTTLAELLARPSLDLLTLLQVTNGPTCEPVRFNFGVWFTAVIVRVTTIDPELTPKTPDGEWYFPDLAVLRVFRGQDLEYRRGIHTPTFMSEKPWQWGWPILNAIPILGTPPDITVAVDWRQGCCGEVWMMALP